MTIHEQFLTEKEVSKLSGLSRVTIWRMQREGEFPLRRQIGRRRVGWLKSEVEEWMRTREPDVLSDGEKEERGPFEGDSSLELT